MNSIQNRKYFVGGFFLFFAVLYLLRVFYIQIFTDQYFERAKRVSIEKVEEYPMRGNIYDRNGQALVQNEIAYDIMYTPYRSKIDTLNFCELLGIDTSEFNARVKKAKRYSYRKASVFEPLITSSEFGPIREKLHQFKGVSVKNRTVRKYPYSAAGHVLGYLTRVSKRHQKKDDFYGESDYIGSSGIESYYEKELRGKKGFKYFLRDINGNAISSYMNGELDEAPISGSNLTLSISADIQVYGELLMQGKRGAIVAIEPATGEVLAMVSGPTYDPNKLVGRKFSKNYFELENDPNKILYQRALKSTQPPGSIIKTMQSLIALDLKVANENTKYACNKELVGCHNHMSPLNLPQSIQNSCNPYYFKLVRSIFYNGRQKGNMSQLRKGMDLWEEYVRSFGFGSKMGIDLYGEREGNVPDTREYDLIYGKNRWNYRTIYSLAIGQGEFSLTPLQMANLAVVIANKGHYITPHFIKKINDSVVDYTLDEFFHRTMVHKSNFDLVQKGMQWVVEEPGGTASRARIDSVVICGKTGTSQNPHGEDHSVFIAFAPKDNPKIAIAVFVENAGSGGIMAAPIASLIVEKYLKGEVKRKKLEEKIIATKLYE
ncbi:MAG: penicillin-binding protein 2 [Saprospiraceae bacterium]|jgi:penicillin-binding protein 2